MDAPARNRAVYFVNRSGPIEAGLSADAALKPESSIGLLGIRNVGRHEFVDDLADLGVRDNCISCQGAHWSLLLAGSARALLFPFVKSVRGPIGSLVGCLDTTVAHGVGPTDHAEVTGIPHACSIGSEALTSLRLLHARLVPTCQAFDALALELASRAGSSRFDADHDGERDARSRRGKHRIDSGASVSGCLWKAREAHD